MPWEAARAIEKIERADIVVGIPSFNNARTIGHVVRAAQAGLNRYFPQHTAAIVNSDGGSTDGTQDAVLSAKLDDSNLMLLSTPLHAVHRLTIPYHGIPGKGSAFRMIFEIAKALEAKACVVVDSDLRSITPEWIDLLARPALYVGYDFVAPYYHRHKYDGTITNSIVYPMTRALYGMRVRQPIGGDFGVSGRLLARYLELGDWETDVARYGIDIWMTTVAIAEGFRVCQSFLGAKLHDAKDPGADLSAMLVQVAGSVFQLMQAYDAVWQKRAGSEPVDLFGFRFDVGLDPIQVNVDRMLHAFRRGCAELGAIWEVALTPETRAEALRLGASSEDARGFHMPDELWVRILVDLACAHKQYPLERGHILKALAPLYLGRVASFVVETEPMVAAEVEGRIEKLCLAMEAAKPHLAGKWNGREPEAPAPAPEISKGGLSDDRHLAADYGKVH